MILKTEMKNTDNYYACTRLLLEPLTDKWVGK